MRVGAPLDADLEQGPDQLMLPPPPTGKADSAAADAAMPAVAAEPPPMPIDQPSGAPHVGAGLLLRR